MTADKQIIINAIIKGIEIGNDRGKLLAIVGKKWQLSQRTFDRYWKVANQQHAERQIAIKIAIADTDKAAAIESRKKAIMTADERKEYLTKTILGEVTITLKKPFWNPEEKKMQFIPVNNPADESTRIRAIAELNKMEGDYAPAKIAQTNKDGEDVPIMVLSIDPLNINNDTTDDGAT